jgi:hypothetical protein
MSFQLIISHSAHEESKSVVCHLSQRGSETQSSSAGLHAQYTEGTGKQGLALTIKAKGDSHAARIAKPRAGDKRFVRREKKGQVTTVTEHPSKE